MSEASHNASGATERRFTVQLPPLVARGVQTTSNCTSRHSGCRSSALPTRTLISSMLAGVFANSVSNSMARPFELRSSARLAAMAADGLRPGCWGAIVNSWLRAGGAILRQRSRDEIVNREYFGDTGGGMSGAPDIAPALGTFFASADVDVLSDIDRAALRQVIRVEARDNNGRPQHVGLQAGKGGGQQNIVGAARNQHLLVPHIGHALFGCDELGAHIGEVAAERLRGAQRPAVADASGQHDRAIEETSHRTDEHERIEPAGLAASAGR